MNCFMLSLIAAVMGVPVFAAAAFAMAVQRYGWGFSLFLALCLASAFAALVEFRMGHRYWRRAEREQRSRAGRQPDRSASDL